jgi:hypothetical protein
MGTLCRVRIEPISRAVQLRSSGADVPGIKWKDGDHAHNFLKSTTCVTILRQTGLRIQQVETSTQKQTSTSLQQRQGRPLITQQELREWGESPAGLAWEAQLQRAAKRLEEEYSQVPFYAERAKKDPGLWRDLASSNPNMGLLP